MQTKTTIPNQVLPRAEGEKGNAPNLFAPSQGGAGRPPRTQWPRIGGPTLQPVSANAFLEPDYLERYRPGNRAQIYVAGCGPSMADPTNATGLQGLSRRLGPPLFKASVSEATDLRARTAQMNVDHYAGCYLDPRHGLVLEPGYNTWTIQTLHATGEPSPGSPLRVSARAIDVMLPENMSLRVFEKLLHLRLVSASLASWVDTPGGKAHFKRLNLDTSIAKRLTSYSFGSGRRVSKAEEIYCFRPRKDTDRLIMIVEHLLLEYVRGDLAGTVEGLLKTRPLGNQGYRPRL